MPQSWSKLILALSAISLLFSSCSREISDDKPLPASYSPTVIISSDNQVVYAIDPTTMAKYWEFSMPQGLPATSFAPSPLLYRGRLYLATINNDSLYKLNARTGKLVARMAIAPPQAFNMIATPIADGALIYLAASNGNFYAIDTGTAVVKWQFTAGSPLVSSPTIFENKIYFASTGGVVYCMDKANGWDPGVGGSMWQLALPGSRFVSSPAVSKPYIYIGSNLDSNMYCIYLNEDPATPGTGLLRWKYKAKGNISSSPTAYTGKCFFGCEDFRLYCIDTSLKIGRTSPDSIWIARTSSQIFSSPFASGNDVYIASNDYNLYAFNIINGSQKWAFKSNGLIKSSPISYKGTVYIGSYDKHLYAIDSANGTMKWQFYVGGQMACSPVIDDLINTQRNSGISGYTN